MSVISQLQNLAGSVQVQPTRNATEGLPQFTPIADAARGDLLRARGSLLRIQRALETLAEAADISTRFLFGRPRSGSSEGLSLDLTQDRKSTV